MTVRDASTLAQKTVLIVNSDVAECATLATRYERLYGIPAANRFTAAMGTADFWEYTGSRFAGFWTDLYNHVESVGAYAVFLVAGCPSAIECVDYDTELENGNALNLALLVGYVKRIYESGADPAVWPADTDRFAPMKWVTDAYATTLAAVGGAPKSVLAASSSIIEQVEDADYSAAVTTAGTAHKKAKWLRYKSSFDGDFSAMDSLLTGWVGYYPMGDGTTAANTLTYSRSILGRAGNCQGRRADLTARKIVVACGLVDSGDTGNGPVAKSALIAKKFDDLGFDVTWFYNDSAQSDNAANVLAPEAAGLQATGTNWDETGLQAGTQTDPESVDCDLLVGYGLQNGRHADWIGSAINITANCIVIGGKSSNGLWGKQCQVDGGHSAIVQQADYWGYHGTAQSLSRSMDAALAVFNGYSLAEAAYLGDEWSFLAIGDPLCRPFQV